MPLLLVTNDKELEERCRRAASADYSIEKVTSVAGLLSRLSGTPPSVVLLDAQAMSRTLEQDAGRIVTAAGTGRVIVMTAEFNEDEEVALLRAGVKGCCRRGVDPESLRQVLSVTQSGVWVTRSLLPRLVTELRRFAQQSATSGASADEASASAPKEKATASKSGNPLSRLAQDKLMSLTPREQEIIKLIAGGSTNKEVGEVLDISDRTVKGHLSNIFLKLGTPDRVKLMLYLQGDRGVTSEATGKQ